MPRSYPSYSTAQVIAALPAVLGGAAALVVALFFALLPDWRLEGLVAASGLPRLLSLAQPPLGLTARGLLAIGAGAMAGAVTWSALFLLVGPGGVFAPRVRAAAADDDNNDDMPVVRRADAHPDAPPRRPLSAAELETLPDEVSFPFDLDQPLAAFDPHAIPAFPREPVRAIRPGDPIPSVRREPLPIARPERPSSIEALLDRLERKAGRARTS